MKSKHPQTYQTITRSDGRTVRVTVPENNDESDLFAAIKDNLSLEAVAAMAAYLAVAETKDDTVNRQIKWFTQELIRLLGVEQYGELLENIGL